MLAMSVAMCARRGSRSGARCTKSMPQLFDTSCSVNASEIATSTGSAPRGGALLGKIQVLAHTAIAVKGGTIVAVGPESDLLARFRAASELDARHGTIVPGFVDAHTHPVFLGTREDEFEMRTRGATYVEI